MDQFDEMLRERAKREPFPLPEEYAGRVFRTCADLKEPKSARRPRRGMFRQWGWIAALLALCIAVPNASPAAAAALKEMPVLGAIVELVTFRTYTYDDGHGSASVAVPELGGSEAAQELDRRVQEDTDRLITKFQEDCEAIGQGYLNLDVTSRVVTDTDQWFTLRVDAVETQASGYQFSRFYHIDRSTGNAVTLRDLFREDADYTGPLSDEVRRQMEAQMADDSEKAYFPEEFTGIDPEQNFYWNEDGDLVLVFDEYTIAAGFMGMVEFTIPAQVYDGLLK